MQQSRNGGPWLLRKLEMKLLWKANMFGWHMTGLLGKDAAWFLGYSRRPAALDEKSEGQAPVAYADRIAFESAMAAGKGCDVWPSAGDYVERTGRELIALKKV
jgi:hypothetical protein